MEFTYWNIIGLGEFVRYACLISNIEYKENNPASFEEYFTNKESLGLDFPNLPYIKDTDGFTLTETEAIVRYIAGKYKPELLGKTIKEKAQVDNVIGVINDLRKKIFDLIFKEKPKDFFAETTNLLAKKLNYLNKFIGNNEFILNYITIADIHLAILNIILNFIVKELKQEKLIDLNNFPNVLRVNNNFNKIEAIKNHLLTDLSKRSFLPDSMTEKIIKNLM